jgi:glycosyltransferase involved in cell wall biosynthesis
VLKGLIISQTDSKASHAYIHRVTKLTDCLRVRDFHCDIFYMKDHLLLYKQTSSSFFMPLWLGMMRKYDFIYTGCEGAGHAVFFCKPFVQAPIMYDVHGDIEAQSALTRQLATNGRISTPSPRVRIVCAMAMASADQIITVCKPHTEFYIRQGISPEHVSMIRNGVDLDLFKELPFPEKPEYTIGYAGAFQNWQGMGNLIDAMDQIEDPTIRLLMIGFDTEDEPLKRELSNKFGNRVTLVDRVDRSTLVDKLQSVGVLIIPRFDHPAIRHAFPTKFAEYAAMGRPIMVNDVDETAQFVREYRCGFVADPTPKAMAQTIRQIAQTPLKELAEMGQRARKMAEVNFSWNVIGDEYAAMVTSVVERYRSRGSQ